jgi:hypothetical protein
MPSLRGAHCAGWHWTIHPAIRLQCRGFVSQQTPSKGSAAVQQEHISSPVGNIPLLSMAGS